MQYNASFHSSRNANFQLIICHIFLYFCPKYRLSVLIRTASIRQFLRVHTIYAKIWKIMSNLVNPTFPYIKLCFPGCSLYKIVNVMITRSKFSWDLKNNTVDCVQVISKQTILMFSPIPHPHPPTTKKKTKKHTHKKKTFLSEQYLDSRNM